MNGKVGRRNRLLRARHCWLAAAALVAAGAGVVPAAAATGGVRAHAAGTISTFAGGVGGPAKATTVALTPCGVSWAGGSAYAGAGGSVRQVSATGRLTTPAGIGTVLPRGDGGPAVKAALVGACGVAFDRSGNLVIADSLDQRIRVVAKATGTFYGKAMTAGRIYTVAGNGSKGSGGDGGPATHAELRFPQGVAVDGAGNLLIADQYNQRIRVVAVATGTFYGQPMTAGDIYTVAGTGSRGFSGDGGPATSATLDFPTGVAVDGAGNLVLADFGNDRIRVVAKATGTFYGQAMTAGHIYTIAGNGEAGFSGDGGLATRAALNHPQGVAADSAGNLVIADAHNERVRVVAKVTGTFYGKAMTAGHIYTVAGNGTSGFAGDGGPATSAELNGPSGVAVDGSGNLVIADFGNNRMRVVAAATGTFYGQAMTAGNIYTIAGTGSGDFSSDGSGFSGDGGPATSAEIDWPVAVATDGAGNVLIVDLFNRRIRVAAAATGTFYGQAMTAGDLYTVAGNGIYGFSGDGGPATSAELANPGGVAVDDSGNLVIADYGNSRIRVVAAATGTFYGQAMTAGHIYTVAGNGTDGFSGDGGPATSAEISDPEGVGVDGAGNLVIADTVNQRIRVVAKTTGTFYGQPMTAGDIYTVAGNGTPGFSGDGGPGTSAELRGPWAVTVDAAGNVVIADFGNNRVRVVAAATGTFYGQAMTVGDIYTVAGNGTGGFSGDGGPATSAELDDPQGVAVDGAGNLVIADSGSGRVRVVALATGTFYEQAMTAGDIYTVAGNGGEGFSGDGGPATGAQLRGPQGVAVDGAGNLLIADTENMRVREVAG